MNEKYVTIKIKEETYNYLEELARDIKIHNKTDVLYEDIFGEVVDRLVKKLEVYAEVMRQIKLWGQAYPERIAREPTPKEWEKSRSIRINKDLGVTEFVISGMRHVAKCMCEFVSIVDEKDDTIYDNADREKPKTN